jgi:hypothetical protein
MKPQGKIYSSATGEIPPDPVFLADEDNPQGNLLQ